MSIVLLGATSGSVTLQEPAVAGSTTINLPATSGTMAVLPTATGVLTEAAGGTGTTTGYYGFKNRIINGAMVIDQRNAGASSTTPTINVQTYGSVDRFAYVVSQASKFTMQQTPSATETGFATRVAAGFSNYLACTVGASANVTVSATDFFGIQQPIEGLNVGDLAWGTANAKTITFSFWVNCSLTGTFGGSLRNAALNRSYPFTYTISAANTWEQKSITIAGETSGTWLTTNGVGMYVQLNLGYGSTYSNTPNAWVTGNFGGANGCVNWVSTNSATFYITGVQLEKGSTATSFDYRPYTTELQLCQRYCIKYTNATSGTYGYFPVACAVDGVTTAQGTLAFPVPIRSPSILSLTTTGTAANYSLYSAASVRALSVVPALTTANNDGLGCQLTLTVTAGLVSGNSANFIGTNSASPYLLFQSEL